MTQKIINSPHLEHILPLYIFLLKKMFVIHYYHRLFLFYSFLSPSLSLLFNFIAVSLSFFILINISLHLSFSLLYSLLLVSLFSFLSSSLSLFLSFIRIAVFSSLFLSFIHPYRHIFSLSLFQSFLSPSLFFIFITVSFSFINSHRGLYLSLLFILIAVSLFHSFIS